jgi:hypothetical protein
MIVLRADSHKRSHTIAAVSAATGELIDEQTVPVGVKGFAALVVWARELGSERVWALEDCRHVSGSFERFLIARGERVVRVTTKLMADSRRGARARVSSLAPMSSMNGRARVKGGQGPRVLGCRTVDGGRGGVRCVPVIHPGAVAGQSVVRRLGGSIKWAAVRVVEARHRSELARACAGWSGRGAQTSARRAS